MMPPALLATAAVLLVAPGAAAQARDDARTPGPKDQGDLYAPAPARASYARSSRLFRAYGMTIRPIELDPGVRLGPFATAPRAAAGAVDRRAGVAEVRRAWQLPLIVVLLAAAAAVAVALGAPSTARANVPDGFVGIATEDVYTGTDAYAREQLARQRAAGITIARQVFRWNEIEPRSNSFDLSATDRFVLNAARAGIRVLPVLQGEPAWATSRPKGSRDRALFPPKRSAHFGRFAAVLALRYGPNGSLWSANHSVAPRPILAYQLWNEPNLPLYWGGRPNARSYARLVLGAARRLRRIQPDAYIVSAGIPESALGQNPRRFVRSMLRAGAGRGLDAIGVHPYARNVRRVLGITRSMRRAADHAEGRRLDLWVTEIGWGAGGPTNRERTVALDRQGPVVAAAFRSLAALRDRLRLRGIIYFAWRDSAIYAGGRDFWGLHTGLIDRAGRDKPGMAVAADALRSLA